MKVYQRIAQALEAMRNCEAAGNRDWQERHHETILKLVVDQMPSGSGIDGGTSINLAGSNGERLEFLASFHHMSEHGYYDGWTSYTVIVTPSLAHGLSVRVTGRDRNDIKNYLAETYHAALTQEVAS